MANPFVTQAPQMMQGYAPDLAQQQIALQRQQQLADMLKQSALAAPDPTQVINGVAVKQSPLLALSKVLQGYMGGKMQTENDQKQADIGSQSAQRYAEALKNALDGSSGGAMPASDAPLSGAPQASTPGQIQVDPAKNKKIAQILQMSMLNPEVGNKLMENFLTPTNEGKRDAELGIDVPQSRALEIGKRTKESTQSLLPGQTNILADGARVVAPNFDTGVAGGFGADGKPIMAPIAGSGVLASMAGDKKRAEAAGSAGYDLIEVNTPAGKVMMTKEQAAQLSGGGTPQQPPIQFKASNGVTLNFANMTPQQVFDNAVKSSDPKLMQAFNEWAQSGNKAPGIPLMSDANKAQQVGEVKVRQDASSDLNKNWITTSLNPVKLAGESAKDTMGQIASLRNINASTGWGAEAASTAANMLTRFGIGGEEAKKIASNAQEFQSVVLDRMAADLRKNTGPQTEGDAERSLKTFAQLKNTPEANNFIMDLAEAKAQQDMKRNNFYQEALPIAQKSGDMTEIDRRWNRIQPSLWDAPGLQKYKVKK